MRIEERIRTRRSTARAFSLKRWVTIVAISTFSLVMLSNSLRPSRNALHVTLFLDTVLEGSPYSHVHSIVCKLVLPLPFLLANTRFLSFAIPYMIFGDDVFSYASHSYLIMDFIHPPSLFIRSASVSGASNPIILVWPKSVSFIKVGHAYTKESW